MYLNRKIAALVPIKAHSERIEEKNFRLFCGKPLYHNIIQTLDQVSAIDEIVINTDSKRVIEEAPTLSRKITIHERPESLCGDFVSTNDIFAYDLSLVEADIYLQTHATNPLVKGETIMGAIQTFEANEVTHDSLFSVSRYQSRFYETDGKAINHNPDELIRTQDLKPLFEENSCIYLFTKESFEKNKRRIGETAYMLETPFAESVDIDEEFTFLLAELLAMYNRK